MTAAHPVVPPRVAVLGPYVDAGVFGPAEVQLAATVARLSGHDNDPNDIVVLALAVAARGPRLGHVCVDLADVARGALGSDDGADVAVSWPESNEWLPALRASEVVATADSYRLEPFRPLVLDGVRLYLQRYFDYELRVAQDLLTRAATPYLIADESSLERHLDEVFGKRDPARGDEQRRAVLRAMTERVTVIAGGPGTGKTRTIAGLLAVAQLATTSDDPPLTVALAAPTGKAAARMTEAIRHEQDQLARRGVRLTGPEIAAATEASTIHSLLGWVPGRRPAHDRHNPLSHNLVIIDETSMVSLPQIARVLDAMNEKARLVMVGDPNQLASIEAGTVLSDVVGPPSDNVSAVMSPALASKITTLTQQHRFASDSPIAVLADAVRTGDAASAFMALSKGDATLDWVEPDDAASLGVLRQRIARVGADIVEAALHGDAERAIALGSSLKVLCATRRGPLGLFRWSDNIEAEVDVLVPIKRRGRWFVGRPIIVTANDQVNRVVNGDVGVLVQRTPDGAEVAIAQGTGLRWLPPSRLDRVETWWAMTIHKSQGSEFDHAVVSLPDAGSPILTRELLYTGITRAKTELTIVATKDALSAAISHPIERASGLCDRLWPGHEQSSN